MIKGVVCLEWQKPSDSAVKGIQTPLTRLHQMEELMAKKEAEMELLRKQLLKAHHTNHELVKQLDTCAEHNIKSILRENASLKSYVSRLSRENAVLRGLQSRQLNTRLKSFERAVSKFSRQEQQRTFTEDEHAQALKIVICANNQRGRMDGRGDGYSQDLSTNS
ncbi:hypothetical protein NP493_150g02028 [Ridgeia piscesae]|uniref:Uncharacterized protein n=1 Tax=Ridgeia piscesae TaxID=27915 RepID=A0AAD9UFV4_RIDPI|nr:hypothetical protein NP493_150g02028 [Ridgeia piscesae]